MDTAGATRTAASVHPSQTRNGETASKDVPTSHYFERSDANKINFKLLENAEANCPEF